MKYLVAYYTRDGHTKAVAAEIAQALGADLEEIVDAKSRKGIIGWILAGRDATQKRSAEIGTLKHDPSQYDLVAIGTPIWAWTMVPAIRTYLTQQQGKIKQAAFFCTEGSSGGAKAFGFMEELLGKKPLATLELNSKELADGSYKSKLLQFAEALKK